MAPPHQSKISTDYSDNSSQQQFFQTGFSSPRHHSEQKASPTMTPTMRVIQVVFDKYKQDPDFYLSFENSPKTPFLIPYYHCLRHVHSGWLNVPYSQVPAVYT